jgi:enoyl-CoA hydratase/carnithine racemase
MKNRSGLLELVINYNHNSRIKKATMTHPDIHFELAGDEQEVAVIRLTRSAKRNALNDGLILALRDLFEKMPAGVRAAVIDGEGPHFCAGLDLSELKERDAGQGLYHSRMWHAALERVQYGPVPEGSRGIFVGGGGAVRIPKLIGAARMTDMMLTGRVYNAQDGEKVGFAQYLVPEGQAFDKALELAKRVAQNAPLTNYALMHALPRIAEQPADQGFLTEAMMAAIAQSAPEAKSRLADFLEGRAAKVRKD